MSGSEAVTGPRVTVGLLREAGVCSNWFERFAAWYPGGVDVTVERCVSQCNEWPWDDAAEALLTDEGQAAYCPILVDADQSCACDERTNEQAARARSRRRRSGTAYAGRRRKTSRSRRRRVNPPVRRVR